MRFILGALLASFTATLCSAQTGVHVIKVVPAPVYVEYGTGVFSINASTSIRVAASEDDSLRELANFLVGVLSPAVGADLTIETGIDSPTNSISLVLEQRGAPAAEAYRLESNTARITISSGTYAGLFYGIQTLRQLVLPAGMVPAVVIEDEPRFGYRGMHLDVGRHMFPVSFIKKYIDLLATYKFNRFHWHLTEDQGWRIEILKYPLLTEIGAYRRETAVEKNFEPLGDYIGDGQPYGGFFTQDEIREVVEYARQRHVTIIPEIEMPGHSVAALAAYPELACTPGPFEVSTYWGVRDDIYCPSERTFAFLEDVLTEVMGLFPGEYIHIGGDEAPRVRWEQSTLAQEVMIREGLADEHELQSYFIRRIERFLLDHGRRLIGWDEILEGGLAPEATVMSWRGMAGGIDAARQGHDVIMTPGSHMYFDHYQGSRDLEPLAIGGFSPLEKVYSFEPVPDELSDEEAGHILGAQANVWTEYMKTGDHVEYMVAPRLLALAEVVWSPREARDWEGFVDRLPRQFVLLDEMGINYRVPSVTGLEGDRLTLGNSITVELSTPAGSEAIIRYTLDGSDPDEESNVYDGPFELAIPEGGVVVAGRTTMPSGRTSAVARARFGRTELQPSTDAAAAQLGNGVRYFYYEANGLRTVDGLGTLDPVRTGVTDVIGLADTDRPEGFGYIFEGYLDIPADAVYRFDLTSDDGSRLWIDGQLVVDHDGLHSARTRTGMLGLAAGMHTIKVAFFQAGGGKSLKLAMFEDAEGAEVDVSQRLFHAND